MPYEIDFLPVGDGCQGGDAIALRFGPDLSRRDGHKVILIDGGRSDTGMALVHHVWNVYGTSDVDLVVNTHPDIDHVGGLRPVLDLLNVRQLAMHLPWLHAQSVKLLFANPRLTTTRLANKLRAALEAAHGLEQLARRRGVEIVEPFAGGSLEFGDAWFRVLGPDQAYYETLLCAFEGTPAARVTPTRLHVPGSATARAPRIETLHPATETLRDGSQTSAENNTSVVAMLGVDGRRVLFTGDAGEDALARALLFAQHYREYPSLTPLDLLQVPHHGSRHNIGPILLNYARATNAVISAPPASEDHPFPSVVNALIRRGTTVHSTRGMALRYAWGAGPRIGWSTPAQPLEFTHVFSG